MIHSMFFLDLSYPENKNRKACCFFTFFCEIDCLIPLIFNISCLKLNRSISMFFDQRLRFIWYFLEGVIIISYINDSGYTLLGELI